MKFAKQTESKSCPNIISPGDKVQAKAKGHMGWPGRVVSAAFLASDKQKAVGSPR